MRATTGNPVVHQQVPATQGDFSTDLCPPGVVLAKPSPDERPPFKRELNFLAGAAMEQHAAWSVLPEQIARWP